MESGEFSREIRRAWQILEDLGISRLFACSVSLPMDYEFRDTSLDPNSLYEDIFKVGMKRSHYNFTLFDYAYFQFSLYDATSWRLAYYPNPWLSGLPGAEDKMREWEALEELGVLEFDEVSDLLSELRFVNAVPFIRLDYSPGSYRELTHPAAHIHIGSYADNRWSSAIAPGPLCFSMLIAKMYYQEAWSSKSKLCGAHVHDCIDELFLRVIADTVIAEPFSEKERLSLHYGKNLRQ